MGCVGEFDGEFDCSAKNRHPFRVDRVGFGFQGAKPPWRKLTMAKIKITCSHTLLTYLFLSLFDKQCLPSQKSVHFCEDEIGISVPLMAILATTSTSTS